MIASGMRRWRKFASRRSWRALAVPSALAATGLVVAACGGGGSHSSGVESVRSTTSTTSASTAMQAGSVAASYAAELRYSQCMRAHGVPNFPDPTIDGGIFGGIAKLGPNVIDSASPQFAAADKACEHLDPNGGDATAAQFQLQIEQDLKLTQCMRAHGVPNFPEPTVTNGGTAVGFNGSAIDPRSPQFQRASSACGQYDGGGMLSHIGRPRKGLAR